jgi:hypothetical protein
MAKNSIKKTIFWSFLTISPKKMGLMIWLGAFFQVLTLGHTSCPLAGLRVPFWILLGVPKWPKTAKKNYFLIVLDHFS